MKTRNNTDRQADRGRRSHKPQKPKKLGRDKETDKQRRIQRQKGESISLILFFQIKEFG
jgi:hypothetical protein